METRKVRGREAWWTPEKLKSSLIIPVTVTTTAGHASPGQPHVSFTDFKGSAKRAGTGINIIDDVLHGRPGMICLFRLQMYWEIFNLYLIYFHI